MTMTILVDPTDEASVLEAIAELGKLLPGHLVLVVNPRDPIDIGLNIETLRKTIDPEAIPLAFYDRKIDSDELLMFVLNDGESEAKAWHLWEAMRKLKDPVAAKTGRYASINLYAGNFCDGTLKDRIKLGKRDKLLLSEFAASLQWNGMDERPATPANWVAPDKRQ